MNVYIVRHGLSELGEKSYQMPETPLSAVGFEQAQSVAKRFSSIPIDVLVTSTYTRAIQTAEELRKVKSVPLISSDLFIERVMPSSFHGKPVDDPEIHSIYQTIRAYYYEKDWHYSDEENFADLKNRAESALNYLQALNKENIAVVTHGYFLLVLTYLVLFGPEMNSKNFQSFREHTNNSNAGLSIFQYENNTWTMKSWNDTAHI